MYPNRSSLDGTMAPEDGSVWTLELQERGEKPLRGRLASEEAALDVEGTSALRGGLSAESTTAYYVSRDGRTSERWRSMPAPYGWVVV